MTNREKFNLAVTLLCEINEEARNEELKGIINDLFEFDRPENWCGEDVLAAGEHFNDILSQLDRD